MINDINTLLFPCIQCLHESNYDFHITGSRFFGGIHDDSDWDFMCSSSTEVEEFLTRLGFENISAEEYNGDETIDKVFRFGTVDVQLIHNLERKLYVQGLLKQLYPAGLPGDKDTRRFIWQNTAKLLHLLGK